MPEHDINHLKENRLFAKCIENRQKFHIDPYGGFVREGKIHTNTGSFQDCPFLGATMPKTSVGKSLVKSSEETLLTFSAIIGTW